MEVHQPSRAPNIAAGKVKKASLPVFLQNLFRTPPAEDESTWLPEVEPACTEGDTLADFLLDSPLAGTELETPREAIRERLIEIQR